MHFQIYCHEDCKCSLKVVGKPDLHEFESILAAIDAARELSEAGESPLTVYSTIGTVIFETMV